MRNKLIGSETLESLDKIVHEQQPALLGYVSHAGGSLVIQDVFALSSSLCRAVIKHIEMSLSVEDAINRVISDLDLLLTTGSATREVLTALSGLRIPTEVERIQFEDDLFIRRLTVDEISDLGSNDISSEGRYELTSRFVTTALVSISPTPITISVVSPEFIPDFATFQNFQNQIETVLCALHILKSGRVGVVASFTTIRPNILPNMGGQTSSPLVVNPFSGRRQLHFTSSDNYHPPQDKLVPKGVAEAKAVGRSGGHPLGHRRIC